MTDILHIGEALLKVDPLQPAQVVGLIHCGDRDPSEITRPTAVLVGSVNRRSPIHGLSALSIDIL